MIADNRLTENAVWDDQLLGEQFKVEKYIEVVIIVVVLVSISPGIYAWTRHRLLKRKSTTTNLA